MLMRAPAVTVLQVLSLHMSDAYVLLLMRTAQIMMASTTTVLGRTSSIGRCSRTNSQSLPSGKHHHHNDIRWIPRGACSGCRTRTR
jgi:hypothetical protein